MITLVVDDFRIKYKGDKIQHFINALKDRYAITIDKSGSLFCGVILDWDYDKREIRCSMPGYISKLLQKLKYQYLTKPYYSPYLAPTIIYGAKIQKSIDDYSPKLDTSGNTVVRQIVGAALHISRFIDMALLVACNQISL